MESPGRSTITRMGRCSLVYRLQLACKRKNSSIWTRSHMATVHRTLWRFWYLPNEFLFLVIRCVEVSDQTLERVTLSLTWLWCTLLIQMALREFWYRSIDGRPDNVFNGCDTIIYHVYWRRYKLFCFLRIFFKTSIKHWIPLVFFRHIFVFVFLMDD